MALPANANGSWLDLEESGEIGASYRPVLDRRITRQNNPSSRENRRLAARRNAATPKAIGHFTPQMASIKLRQLPFNLTDIGRLEHSADARAFYCPK